MTGSLQIKKNQEGLTANTIKRHHANIRRALQDAFEKDVIPSNPADKVKLAKITPYIPNYYNRKQVEELLKVVKGHVLETAILITAFYGLRREEVLGLKWENVDFVNKTITIINTVTGSKTIHKRKYTKTKSSYRTLPLLEVIENYLLELKKSEERNKKLFGKSYIPNEYICRWENGKEIKPYYVTHTFPLILEKYDMPRIRFHDLRHSCASMLLALGFNLKQIQEWLGHSSIVTTGNIYAHIDFADKQNMGNVLGNSIIAC